MKKLLIIAVIISSSIGAQAQSDAISRFFQKYEDDDEFTQVNITSRMFSLFTDLEINDKDDQEILDAISKIKGLKILAKDKASNGQQLYRDALGKLPKGEYDELMSIKDGDQDMKFMIKEKGKIITELVLVAGGDDGFFIMSITGDIDLKQITNISRKMNIDGLQNLDKLDVN